MSRTLPRLARAILITLVSVGATPPATRQEVLFATAEAGSAQATDTPESVGQQYMAAMRKGDWAGAAALMHPDGLRRFRGFIEPVALADTSGEVAQQFFGVAKSADLAKLSDSELFARFFKFITTASPEVVEAFSGAEMRPIGHVMEGPDVAHLMGRVRMSVQGITIEKVEAISLQRAGTSWRVQISAEIEGLAAAIKARSGK